MGLNYPERLVHTLGLQRLLEEQVAVVARKIFAQLHVLCQLCFYLDLVVLPLVTHAIIILSWITAMQSTWEYP